MIQELLATGRLTFASLIVCSLIYPAALWAIAQSTVPGRADASLVVRDGQVVGSSQVAQAFTQPRYFWPRPSAVNYAANAAGGSNWSPTNDKITARARSIIARLGATPSHPVPADLVTASGSGLDPDISVAAAHYQAKRVAKSRGMPLSKVETLIKQSTRERWTVPLGGDPVVNVLALNMALDQAGSDKRTR